MNKVFILLLCCLLPLCAYAQGFDDEFRTDVSILYEQTLKATNRLITNTYKEQDNFHNKKLKYIYVPRLNLTANSDEILNSLSFITSQHNSFLLYLDDNLGMAKGYVYLYEDDKCVGIIDYSSFSGNQNDYRFIPKENLDDNSYYYLVATKLNQLKPDVVFQITMFSNSFWYIKDNKFGVINFNLANYNQVYDVLLSDYLSSLELGDLLSLLNKGYIDIVAY